MKINEIMCQIAIEESVIKVKSCYIGNWENSSNDDELRSNLGRERFESEGSEIGRNLKFHNDIGEEMTVEEVEKFLCSESWRPDVGVEDRGDDVEGEQLSGLQNTRRLNEAIDELGGQFGCFKEVVDKLECGNAHEQSPSTAANQRWKLKDNYADV
ncbi:hypothetical protein VNO80_01558 [Phaseolus coccineus]|uniref:Uncharacterized protein n=1 Tax=Phaseolus coccineus TaxID=3886 RepID=A0AAN9RT08_PHACN